MPLCRFDISVLENRKPAFLLGVDEAGRGPLAGPVTASAAWVPLSAYPAVSPFINDSKKLSPARRERAFRAMLAAGVRFGFGFALPAEIDRVNILEATFNAMSAAVRRLLFYTGAQPSGALVLVDGPHRIKRLEGCAQEPVVDGDARSLSIAAASIFAKVLRDRWLGVLDARYPGYGLAGHKGYGTAAHLEALNRLGPTAEHRMSFSPVRIAAGLAR
ncbi:MAG: ribonuclease HII [Elusimicrobia bacterium GWA2_61_42]|nr:MAG: ribonuclease HII [Elusimicrobia bacterium GWA2_61_42]OGR75137.1 MAG: ribonuclease HII [Elusimicrobia bacterium GWC2_61_25]